MVNLEGVSKGLEKYRKRNTIHLILVENLNINFIFNFSLRSVGEAIAEARASANSTKRRETPETRIEESMIIRIRFQDHLRLYLVPKRQFPWLGLSGIVVIFGLLYFQICKRLCITYPKADRWIPDIFNNNIKIPE